MADKPIPSLASHFRREFQTVQLALGHNPEVIKEAPDRWGLFISCCIGTRAIVPPALGGVPTPYGVMVMPVGADPKDRGILIDDELPPLEITLPTWGNVVTQPFWLSPYTAEYTVSILEIFYMPELD